jgi:hypothetical protein
VVHQALAISTHAKARSSGLQVGQALFIPSPCEGLPVRLSVAILDRTARSVCPTRWFNKKNASSDRGTMQ